MTLWIWSWMLIENFQTYTLTKGWGPLTNDIKLCEWLRSRRHSKHIVILYLEGMMDQKYLNAWKIYTGVKGFVSWCIMYCVRPIKRRWVWHKIKGHDNQSTFHLAPRIFIFPCWGPYFHVGDPTLNMVHFHSTLTLQSLSCKIGFHFPWYNFGWFPRHIRFSWSQLLSLCVKQPL